MSGVNPQGVHVSSFKVPSAEELNHEYLWRYAQRLPARGEIGISKERQRWSDYQEAFSEMLSSTSTEWAPWYVVPADRKWFARICAAAILAHTLLDIDPQYPNVDGDHQRDLVEAKSALEAQAPKGAAADPFQAELIAQAEKERARKERTRAAKAERRAAARAAGKS
jgi:hypothetical protein